MQEQISYGNTLLEFSVSRSARKTLAIEVHPDQSVQVIAPPSADLEDIKQKVLKRGSWIVKQQLYFEQFLPRTPEREYVSGESHLYLGRKYLLKVRQSVDKDVKLRGGELQVFVPQPENNDMVRRQLADWYYQHARRRFSESIRDSLKKFDKYQLSEPPLIIKRMAKRWGSCTPNGNIILNPEIIKAPSKCIEYVVIHELCHLIHQNHSRQFYHLQSEIMPGWEKWKERLERTLI
ncbi:Putative metal-dependent hydrolase [Fulvivirga imtechensis AK7]|uniref:Putative metal-dependent hydrolase n=1 Tax=Fulvivirga imtechensis AK7 TaxID=1237149 RepID=L8JY54_9BACT|nr:SprT family zinc-dependent metalloprotease [Fulvivirga imtechensis]ELR72579.1 Putative metal-dependent hydrolase [Fulvivirga imtechensis AK7]